MASTACELTWLFSLLQDMSIPHPSLALLFYDNKTALHIAQNLIYHERTKYIEIDSHLIEKKVQSGILKTLHVISQNQLGDIFTKPLGLGFFKLCKQDGYD